MTARTNLNTRLLPLSILISSLISGAALAERSLPTQPSDQDIINQVQSYANTNVISPEHAETLIKRLTANPEKLKTEHAQVKQELIAAEKAQKEANTEARTTRIEKAAFNAKLKVEQNAKSAAEKALAEAHETQNAAIAAINKDWSLSTENISTKLGNAVSKESVVKATLDAASQKIKAAQDKQEAEEEKAQQRDETIAKNDSVINESYADQRQLQGQLKKTKDKDQIKKIEDQLEALTIKIDKLATDQEELYEQKSASVTLIADLQKETEKAEKNQQKAEKALEIIENAKLAQHAMAEAINAEKSLEDAEQKLAAIELIVQETDVKFDAALQAQTDAEKQLADKTQQLETINQSLTELNDLDAKVQAQQTIAQNSERLVDKDELAMATHVAGGKQKVTGGMVLASVITEGGEVNLSDDALAHDTQLIEGTLNNSSAHDVNTHVGAQGNLLINGTEDIKATSEGAMVEAGGNVIAGANALVSKMVTAGTVVGNDGALFTETTLTDGQFNLNNGAIAKNTAVNGGQFDVNEGSIADGVTLTGGKFNLKARTQAMKLIVENGDAQIAGNLSGVTLNGGKTTFADSAEVIGTIDSQTGSLLNIYQGANTAQADLNLAGRVELFADDVAQAAASLPSRAVRSAGNMPMEFTLRSVNMNGGALSLRNAKHAKLQLDSLAGHGTFLLGSALQQDASAPVNVIGNADGNFIIQIDGSGIDPTNINVINTGGGDARFTLTDGPVGLGNRMYNLVKDANGQVILAVNESTVAPSTASILAVANTTPVIFNAELNAVLQRLDKQSTEANESGIWGSYLHNNFAVKGRNANFDQTLNGMTLGGDKAAALATGVFSVGGFVSTSSSDIKTDYQSKGKVDSHSFGAYTQYLDNSGYYVNGVVKTNKFDQDISVTSANNSANGNANFSGMGVAVKAGKHINHNNLYVSPYVAMSAFSSGKSAVKLSNGMQAQSSSTRSMIGTIGVNAGYRVVLKNGVEMKPYVSASVDHEFAKNNQVKVNDETFDNNLNGTRINGGVGMNVNLTTNLSINSEVTLSSGKNLKTPTTINLGVAFRL